MSDLTDPNDIGRLSIRNARGRGRRCCEAIYIALGR